MFRGTILFGIIAAIVASKKGFSPIRWIFALGLIGFIVVMNLESAKADEISESESQARAEHGNDIGAKMCVLGIAYLIVMFFLLAATSGP